MELGFDDRVFIVTGGTRGLGLATARTLLAEGARVVLSGRGPDAQTVAATLGSPDRVTGLPADNAHPSTAERLVVAAHETFGRLDGALISVGGPTHGAAMELDDDAWRHAFESVFLGALRIARTVAAAAPGGSIAFVLATSVRTPFPGLALSNGLRPGLGMLAKTLADEVGPAGTRVNGLLPGTIATDRAKELATVAGMGTPTNALQRMGTPEEFGRVAAFVLSPAASYLTGSMIAIDGGAIQAL